MNHQHLHDLAYERAIEFSAFESALESNATWLAVNPSSFKVAGGQFLPKPCGALGV
jgi:hypothetical protein